MKEFTRKLLLTIFLSSCIISLAFAQSNVEGTLRTKSGEPVAAATVLVKGTKRSTASNNEGAFSIKANPNETLVISSVSFETKEVPASGALNIVLDIKIHALEEVEVVVAKGYGKSKRNAVTSVISSVKGSDLAGMPSTNLGSVLQGRATGVQVTNSGGANPPSQKILIRGFTSLQNSTDPLVIMDGINLGRSGLNFVNLADIETIDILKDASGFTFLSILVWLNWLNWLYTGFGSNTGKVGSVRISGIKSPWPGFTQFSNLGFNVKPALKYLFGVKSKFNRAKIFCQ